MKKLILLFLIISASANASMLYKINDGIELYTKDNYPAALNYFKSYIKSNPSDANGYFWLGKTYLKQNIEKEAASAFKKAYALEFLNQNIDKIDFENNLYDNLDDYFDMAASYYEEANYKEASQYADMMLKIDPDCAGAYFIKAKIAYINQDKISAIELLNKAILLNNSLLNTNLANNLGIEKIPDLTKEDCALYAQKAYFKGDINLSIEYLKKYIELDNTNIDIYNMLIDCYIKNQDIENAKEILLKAQKINSNNVSLILQEAFLEDISGNDCEKLLKHAYSINPNNKMALLKLGNFYLDKKNYPEAKKYFETLVNVDDTFYEGYFGYIYSLIQLNEAEDAQNLIKTITALNPDTSEIQYLLSLICYTKREYKEALEYIKEAIKLDKNPYYYVLAGKLSYILGIMKPLLNI
ncbi:tetratricopeptide repeat protein [bacterium]|nr:tetratricopeptide repeat protein [bacterium]